MEVQVVLEKYNVDGYYAPEVFSIEMPEDEIAETYVGELVESKDDFFKYYEISVLTVRTN